MHSKTRFYIKTTVFFAAVATVAVATALALFFLVLRPQVDADAHSHASLYDRLDLSPDEHASIVAVSARFEEQRQALLVEFEELQQELAVLLREDPGYSPRFAATIDELHEVHGQLQELSIRRFFAALEVLPPEKQAELRRLAAETLVQPE